MQKPLRYVGIDLAWSMGKESAFCVLKPTVEGGLAIETLEMVDDGAIVKRLRLMSLYYQLYVGFDAPLRVPNATGNRDIERQFNRDFAPAKISMLPVNRTLLYRQFGAIKGEILVSHLQEVGFAIGTTNALNLFEVYPHATIAVAFHNGGILPYKRKKGRSVAAIRQALTRYQGYLREAIAPHAMLSIDTATLKGQHLKAYEDSLDAVTCAYTAYFAHAYPALSKHYGSSQEGLFVTPF
ncbi:MAG: hypothetical protein KU37_02730 [Sulfuricurvum sp. PC08-66]|nr:MAG: hypothetical protein KU37_02730 [Sulfuricurvum sp. PC08-66]